jgi:hypothetical protein
VSVFFGRQKNQRGFAVAKRLFDSKISQYQFLCLFFDDFLTCNALVKNKLERATCYRMGVYYYKMGVYDSKMGV